MSTRYVKVFYGPCNTFDNNIHKPQKLTGLRSCLQKLGYRVDLVPVEFFNYCRVEMCGHEVFRCNIQNLHFNTHHTRDVVCERAVQAVLEASHKFERARSHLWLSMLIEQRLPTMEHVRPKDTWPVAPKYKKYDKSITCTDCAFCCGRTYPE